MILNSKFLFLFSVFGLLSISSANETAAEMSHGGVSWTNAFEHAVNIRGSEQKEAKEGKIERGLEQFLNSPTPIAEGDIRLNSHGALVMAHDEDQVDNKDRPSFKEWFRTIMTSEKEIDPVLYNGLKRKGVKLDIKENPSLNTKLGLAPNATSQKVIAEIKELLADQQSGITHKTLKDRFIIANADIVRGPGGDEPALTVVDMLNWRTEFPDIRISIGYEEEYKQENHPYTRYMIDTQFANAALIGGNIDFNLRSVRILSSLKLLKALINRALNHSAIHTVSVTVWNSPDSGDPHISEEELKAYSSQLLPKEIPQGKSAQVLLDLYPAK